MMDFGGILKKQRYMISFDFFLNSLFILSLVPYLVLYCTVERARQQSFQGPAISQGLAIKAVLIQPLMFVLLPLDLV